MACLRHVLACIRRMPGVRRHLKFVRSCDQTIYPDREFSRSRLFARKKTSVTWNCAREAIAYICMAQFGMWNELASTPGSFPPCLPSPQPLVIWVCHQHGHLPSSASYLTTQYSFPPPSSLPATPHRPKSYVDHCRIEIQFVENSVDVIQITRPSSNVSWSKCCHHGMSCLVHCLNMGPSRISGWSRVP
ncbi:hypothetical protein BGX38DRAFT_311101 [Terfezia claveryi]|nr:hypothetical protein BGX38DRAFT_311101 [Terfezia claveryi]